MKTIIKTGIALAFLLTANVSFGQSQQTPEIKSSKAPSSKSKKAPSSVSKSQAPVQTAAPKKAQPVVKTK